MIMLINISLYRSEDSIRDDKRANYSTTIILRVRDSETEHRNEKKKNKQRSLIQNGNIAKSGHLKSKIGKN